MGGAPLSPRQQDLVPGSKKGRLWQKQDLSFPVEAGAAGAVSQSPLLLVKHPRAVHLQPALHRRRAMPRSWLGEQEGKPWEMTPDSESGAVS
ncbi:hypothetical protein NDU88_006009 [Pleurodeles waltl]|uniref:Uncharacterized protein n=1 Tax=Pleurodeles waltl TaxID=8319 RepID=A0AAV7N2U2_PLEWA|nr:hypothetical protein NDU88_006009 [Pleurodeles waltl]